MPDLIEDGKSNHTEDAVRRELETQFTLRYNMVMQREYGVNIIVKRGKSRATFTVPQDRWKYFFRERIKAKTPHGKTKPIYHSVVAHQRQTISGTTAVKTHYRGLRHFIWKGYDIRIVMQGKHGVPQASLDITPTSEEDMKEGVQYYDLNDISDRINRVFETGVSR